MKRTHAVLIALVLAFAVVAGTFAALRTTQLGARQTSQTASLTSTQIAQHNRALDRAQAALVAELRKQPPALPATGAASLRLVPAQTVVYVRPKPIVHIVHRHGGENEAANESGRSSEAGPDD